VNLAHVLSVSGGKDSTALWLLARERELAEQYGGVEWWLPGPPQGEAIWTIGPPGPGGSRT
jgi:hypothetical protein